MDHMALSPGEVALQWRLMVDGRPAPLAQAQQAQAQAQAQAPGRATPATTSVARSGGDNDGGDDGGGWSALALPAEVAARSEAAVRLPCTLGALMQAASGLQVRVCVSVCLYWTMRASCILCGDGAYSLLIACKTAFCLDCSHTIQLRV